MEKYLANVAISFKSLMISHDVNFLSCHFIVNRKLTHDFRHHCDFIDADFFVGELFLLYF